MVDKISVIWKQEQKPKDGEVYSGSYIRIEIPENFPSYERDRIEIVVMNDGELRLETGEEDGFIYFCPEQLPKLKEAVDIALLQCKLREDETKE